MKQLLLAGTAFLALAATQATAHADPIVFDYTGSLVPFTVPTTGTYQILAFGAQGGDVTTQVVPPPSPPQISLGGRGVEIGGDFILTAGETLQIAVGGTGASVSIPFGGPLGGAGGGGSFVVGLGNTPLVIAGAGGGAGFAMGAPVPGGDGLTGPNGGSVRLILGGTGGNGGGAFNGGGGGGGGGGFLSAGEDAVNGAGGGQPFPILTGGVADLGGGTGGFGGGGGGEGTCGGGGGGYSGGAGGNFPSGGGSCPGGGGGGSFDAGADQILMAGFQTGNGEVVITELVPRASIPRRSEHGASRSYRYQATPVTRLSSWVLL